ncbi:MAG TPA: hypothetical protein VIK18_13770 [Pirellulales bacterium]
MIRSAVLLAALLGSQAAIAEDDFEQPPINYRQTAADNRVSRLLRSIDSGGVRLEHRDRFGYLPALLRALEISESSQVLVFSKTSLQRDRISPRMPRALYFNDDTYVGFCQNSELMEISVVDPRLGTVFYSLDQPPARRPELVRQSDNCLICHGSSQTHGIPGLLVRSVFPDAAGFPLLAKGSYRIDHTSPIKHRWGGWYVTGQHGSQTHLGNRIFTERDSPDEESTAGSNLTDLGSRFDADAYLTGHSDIVALMVLEHQTEGHNLITRANFLTRMALYHEAALNRELGEAPTHRWDSTTSRIRDAGDPLVKYLLFCDEAELTAPISGSSKFAAEFVKRGPQDSRGRSLRDFDLQRRMFKYPCSYLIGSPSFAALPATAKDYVLRRIWDVLRGQDQSPEFAHLTPQLRHDILEILLATQPDLPAYWHESLPSQP